MCPCSGGDLVGRGNHFAHFLAPCHAHMCELTVTIIIIYYYKADTFCKLATTIRQRCKIIREQSFNCAIICMVVTEQHKEVVI